MASEDFNDLLDKVTQDVGKLAFGQIPNVNREKVDEAIDALQVLKDGLHIRRVAQGLEPAD